MKVSIITPTYNSALTLEKTLRSVFNQDYKNVEHIIVDNASSDDTLKIVHQIYANKENQLKIISEKDKGIADAFNKGIKAATGEIVAILNSDDFYIDTSVLSRVVNAFQQNNTDFVHGNMVFVDELYGADVRHPLLCPITKAFPFNHPAFFVHHTLYKRVGLFKENYRLTMDFEWVCRLYQTPLELKYKGEYLSGAPLVSMSSGGASWKMELRSIDEIELALREHHFWGIQAFYFQNLRRLRIRIKLLMEKMGITFLVKIWRRLKWK